MNAARPILRLAVVAGAVASAGAGASAQIVTRVSVDSSGAQGDLDSGLSFPGISGNGRYVVFDSSATNLVSGDTNGFNDIFVRDLETGATVCMSVDPAGNPANERSLYATISADGRFVAFASNASNLVANDANGHYDIFVRDRDPDGNGIFDEGNDVTTRVSVDSNGAESNGSSFYPSISADGTLVAFESTGSNLVAGDTNAKLDVFVHDTITGATTRVSVDSNGNEADLGGFFPRISADGTHVAFVSAATDLVPGDTNGADDVFVRDLVHGTTIRVSVDSSGNQAALGGEGPPSLSRDGAVVAFWSDSSDLVAGDGNGVADVFCHDRTTGATTRVSVDSSGAEGNDASYWPSLSADGLLVGFTSLATNFAVKSANGIFDDFLHDRATGKTILFSSACPGPTGDGNSGALALDDDGGRIVFDSNSDNLVAGDTNAAADVFVFDRAAAAATWANYGSGFAGTLGVPGFTARGDPVLGVTLTLDLGNSSGAAAPAFLLLGFGRASLQTNDGGTLLVSVRQLLPLTLPADELEVAGDLADDPTLCGLELDLQAIEVDAGAAKGFSFTAGLALVLGY